MSDPMVVVIKAIDRLAGDEEKAHVLKKTWCNLLSPPRVTQDLHSKEVPQKHLKNFALVRKNNLGVNLFLLSLCSICFPLRVLTSATPIYCKPSHRDCYRSLLHGHTGFLFTFYGE